MDKRKDKMRDEYTEALEQLERARLKRIADMRRLRDQRWTLEMIANKYGISKQRVWDLLNNPDNK